MSFELLALLTAGILGVAFLYSSVGHAGALIREADGLLMGGFDPRSNGAVAAF